MNLPETTIIGTGGLGSSLARSCAAKNIPIKSLFNRTVSEAHELADELEVSISNSFPASAEELGSLVFITVPDRAVQPVASELAEITNDFSDHIFAHCSGNESADLLESLSEKGAGVASFHPLQTFTKDSSPDSFNGIYFSMQGNRQAFPMLKNIAQQMGAHTFEISKEQKSHLHAGAVIASNYLNAILRSAVDTASLSGLEEDQVRKALFPLVRQTLENIDDSSFADALTGPIKRGDISTVQRHLELLADQDKLRELYILMGKHTVNIAQDSGAIDGTTARKMRNIFYEQG